LKFQCPNCDQKLSTPEARAGRTGRCPRCKSRITIPPPAASESSVANEGHKLTLIEPPRAPDRAAADAAERQRLEEAYAAADQVDGDVLTSLGIAPLAQYTGERQFPWPLDILLYPTSASGLISIAVITGVPLFLGLTLGLIGWFIPFGGILFVAAMFFVGLYAACYWAECAYDSARGGTRAPEVATGPMNWRDMFSRVIYLVAVYALYLLPVVIYGGFLRRTDWIFWALTAWAIVFFPMGLLAMVIYDSSSALNPLLLLGAIGRTFLSYATLLVQLLAMIILMGLFTNVLRSYGPALLQFLLGGIVSAYVGMVQAHVLGRFYWRCRERIDWGV